MLYLRTSWLGLRLLATASSLIVGLAVLGCEGDSNEPNPIDCDANTAVPDAAAPGVLYTWAGTGENGFVRENEPRLEARFSQPADLLFAEDGNAYILDWNNHMVRRIGTNGRINTVMGSTPVPFPGDGPREDTCPGLNEFTGAIPGTCCYLNHPTGLCELPNGSLLVTSWHNHKLRLFDPLAGTERVLTGRGTGYAGDGGVYTAASVRFNFPIAAKLGPDGHLYVVDQRNQVIRRIRDFATQPDGILETVAGIQSAVPGFNGDGLEPLATTFNWTSNSNPRMSGGMAIGDDGVIYVSDGESHIVRAVDLGANRVTVVAGVPLDPGSGGDGGQGTSAQLNYPLDLELGPDGRLYIVDEENHAIRALDLDTGVLTTVAGQLGKTSGDDCLFPPSSAIGDGKKATEAYLRMPHGIAFDAAGRLYIVDTFHYRVRVMTLETNP